MECDAAPSAAVKVSLPDRPLASCTAAAVVFCRTFHAPSGLGAHDTVRLVSDLLPLATSITLNGDCLLALRVGNTLPLTSHLQPFNELRLQIDRDRYTTASDALAVLEVVASTSQP